MSEDGISSLTVVSPANLHDYNLNLVLEYDGEKGIQEIWLRRNVSDYYTNFPGQDGVYDLGHEYGYIISTSDGFRTITVKRKMIESAVDPVDLSETILSDSPAIDTPVIDGTPICLRFSIYGSILDIYSNGNLICSLLDDSADRINLGTTYIKSKNADLTIKDISIDTDYYFWSRKGNRFMYRGQEAIPVGFNSFPQKYTYGRAMYEYVSDPDITNTEAIDDIKERIEDANKAGARVLRMILRSGGVLNEDGECASTVDILFSFHNTTYFDEWTCSDSSLLGTINPEDYAEYFGEIIKMARARDMFILPALRCGKGAWRMIMNVNPLGWDEPGGGPMNYYYVADEDGISQPQNLVGRAKDVIGYFTDEPAIFAWEYFNEGPGKQWLWEDGDFNKHRPGRVSNFFVACTKILTDENVNDEPITGSMADKHLFSSGMEAYNYAGCFSKPEKPQKTLGENTNNLLHDEVFCRYEDFIDWHTYGWKAYGEKENAISYHLLSYYTLGGYNNDTCPPIIFGEINPIQVDYSDTVSTCTFAGIRCDLSPDPTPYDNNRNWLLKDDTGTTVKSIVLDNSIGLEVQCFDAYPLYMRQNQHYKLYKSWYDGITDLHYQDNRKMGYLLWSLKNYPHSLDNSIDEDGVYDPAIRDSSGKIRGYDSAPPKGYWYYIYLNEDRVYPFYMNLFRWDWGTR